jgi:hypothetical protein
MTKEKVKLTKRRNRRRKTPNQMIMIKNLKKFKRLCLLGRLKEGFY